MGFSCCGGFSFFSTLIESHLILIRQLPKERNTRRRRSFFLFHWPGCCRRSGLGRGKINDGTDVKWKVFRVGGRPPLTAVFGGWKTKRVARLPRAPAHSVKRYKQTEKRDSLPFLDDSLVDSRCREGRGYAHPKCVRVCTVPTQRENGTGSCPAHWEKRDKEKTVIKLLLVISLRCQANLINRLSICRCISPSSSPGWITSWTHCCCPRKGDSLSRLRLRVRRNRPAGLQLSRERGAGPKKIPRARATTQHTKSPPQWKKKVGKNFCGKRRKQENDSPPLPTPFYYDIF